MTTAAEKKAAAKAAADKKKADAKAARDAKKAEQAERNNGGGDDAPQLSTTSETPPDDQVNTIAQPPVEDPDRAPVEGEENIGFKMKGGRNPDPNADEDTPDKKWGVNSRARWGASDSNSTQQHKDSREIERKLAEQQE